MDQIFLKYLKQGEYKFLKIQESDLSNLDRVVKYIQAEQYVVLDHRIVDSCELLPDYILEIDNSGYLFLKHKGVIFDDLNLTKVKNISTALKANKEDVAKILTEKIKKFGDLRIVKSKHVEVWDKLLTDAGFITMYETESFNRKILKVTI